MWTLKVKQALITPKYKTYLPTASIVNWEQLETVGTICDSGAFRTTGPSGTARSLGESGRDKGGTMGPLRNLLTNAKWLQPSCRAAGPLKSSVCVVIVSFVALRFSLVDHFDINLGLGLVTITLSFFLFKVCTFVVSRKKPHHC